MRVVMTGATSGIGLVAARRLLADGAELVVGARRPAAAPPELRSAEVLPLDLADLQSVRAFAARIEAGPPADVLVLNAGLQVTRPQTSAQGYGLTFAANHLAHLLLAQRLAPRLREGGRVVITSSGTHDPELNTSIPPPLHADARRLAHPQTDPQRDAEPGKAQRRAYASSKLANVITARELARRLAATRPDVAVSAFDPAFTPGTGLARGYPAPLRFVFKQVMPRVLRGEHVSTPEVSGGCLADIAAGRVFPDARGDYLSVRHRRLEKVEPSRLARDSAAAAKLWKDSEALIAAA